MHLVLVRFCISTFNTNILAELQKLFKAVLLQKVLLTKAIEYNYNVSARDRTRGPCACGAHVITTTPHNKQLLIHSLSTHATQVEELVRWYASAEDPGTRLGRLLLISLDC